MTGAYLNLSDAYTRRLIAEAEDRAALDNSSCVVTVQREGEAQAKRRRFLAELDARRAPIGRSPWRRTA